MKIIKLPNEMYNELIHIIQITVSERADWLKCCERDADLEYKYISEATNDLTTAKKLLNKLYEAEE